ncbi:MAG: hypothetical protein EOM91_18070 [Sphingobacteriia bacterium]|nr:hypothetical protein [Sphingobacteriia bacterium]NCC38869.1 hypothetical protein [Gammaproteobacteria bacterium]
MKSIRNGAMAALLSVTLTAGCGMTGGLSGPTPVVTRPAEAANITFYRDGSFVGFFATIRVEIDGREVLRVARNEAHTITVDPGQYLIVSTMGFNECRQVVWARPRANIQVRLSPVCN